MLKSRRQHLSYIKTHILHTASTHKPGMAIMVLTPTMLATIIILMDTLMLMGVTTTPTIMVIITHNTDKAMGTREN